MPVWKLVISEIISVLAFILGMGLMMNSAAADDEMTLAGRPMVFYFTDGAVRTMVEAASTGDLQAVEQAVAAGADPNHQGFEGITPLFWVVHFKNKSGLKKLLQLGADPNLRVAKRDMSLMTLAAGAEDPDYLSILLDHGGDPNTLDEQGMPALFMAVRQGRRDNIELLAAHCADLNLDDGFGVTAATFAANINQFDLVAYFLENGLSYNLRDLAASVELAQVETNSSAYFWKQKVVSLLNERGITFPVTLASAKEPRTEAAYAPSCIERKRA